MVYKTKTQLVCSDVVRTERIMIASGKRVGGHSASFRPVAVPAQGTPEGSSPNKGLTGGEPAAGETYREAAG